MFKFVLGMITIIYCALAFVIGLGIGNNFDGNMNNGGSIHITLDQ